MDGNTQKVFSADDFRPGEVRWNSFDLDPERSLEEQLDDFTQDLVLVEFPNGCVLDIEWSASPTVKGRFAVSLVQVPDDHEWEPFERRECDTLSELRVLVRELVRTAADRPSIPKLLFDQGQVGLQINFNELILNQGIPLQEQTDRLKAKLFEASFRHDHYLTIGWEPPHDPSGEFVVRLIHDPKRLENILDRRPPGGRVLSERRCRTVPGPWYGDAASIANTSCVPVSSVS